jgi:hypothetical protein
MVRPLPPLLYLSVMLPRWNDIRQRGRDLFTRTHILVAGFRQEYTTTSTEGMQKTRRGAHGTFHPRSSMDIG